MLDGLIAEIRSECPAEHTRQDVPVLLGCLGSALSSDPVRLRLLVTLASYLPGDPNRDEAGAWRGSLGEGVAKLLAAAEAVDQDDRGFSVVSASVVEVVRASIVDDSINALPVRLQEAGIGLGLAAVPAASLIAA